MLTYDCHVSRYRGAEDFTVSGTILAQAKPLSPERGPDLFDFVSQIEKEWHTTLYMGSCYAVPAMQLPL